MGRMIIACRAVHSSWANTCVVFLGFNELSFSEEVSSASMGDLPHSSVIRYLCLRVRQRLEQQRDKTSFLIVVLLLDDRRLISQSAGYWKLQLTLWKSITTLCNITLGPLHGFRFSPLLHRQVCVSLWTA